MLVNGAGGGTGGFAVQMAKAAGAEVTGVDNGRKQEFMRSLGADHVIDYTRTDYTKTGIPYDLILDLVCERSMFAIRRAVAPGGRYAVVGGTVRALLSAATFGRLLSTGGRRIGVLMVRPTKRTWFGSARWSPMARYAPRSRGPTRWTKSLMRCATSGKVAPLGKLVIEVG